MSALTEAATQLERSIDDQQPSLLLINKFGKAEAEGRGFIDVIALAVERNIPVLIGVPLQNLDAWQTFTDGASVEFSDPNAVAVWIDKKMCEAEGSNSHQGDVVSSLAQERISIQGFERDTNISK